jgi:hypothetical protein
MVNPEFLLPVISRVGLMKHFVQAMDEMAVGIFAWNISFQGKTQRRIFVILQNREILWYSACDETLSEFEGATWREFKAVKTNFLEDLRPEN